MTITYSYKPVLFIAMFKVCDSFGCAKVSNIADYFIEFYQNRKKQGLIIEKPRSIFSIGKYSKKDVIDLLFRYPIKVISQDKNQFIKILDKETITFDTNLYISLTDTDIQYCLEFCYKSLERYYKRFDKIKKQEKIENSPKIDDSILCDAESLWNAINNNLI